MGTAHQWIALAIGAMAAVTVVLYAAAVVFHPGDTDGDR